MALATGVCEALKWIHEIQQISYLSGSLNQRGHFVSLKFDGYQETQKCMRIKFIQLQLDEDFQEDAEMRSNHQALLKRAVIITGLCSEM